MFLTPHPPSFPPTSLLLTPIIPPFPLLSPSQVLVERFKDEIVENDILSSQDGLQVWNSIHTLVPPYSNLRPYF